MTLATFPALVGVGFPALRSPEWSTDINQSISGKKTSLGYFTYPIYHYELTYEVLRSDITNLEWQTLLAFYNSVGARRDLFQFNDPDDNAVTAQQFGTGDGVTSQFQLIRTITGTGGNSWSDPIFNPTTVTILDNGSPLTLASGSQPLPIVLDSLAPAAPDAEGTGLIGQVEPIIALQPDGPYQHLTPESSVNFSDPNPTAANYSVTNGNVSFNIAPVSGHVLTWTGTYKWLVRFDDDTIDFEKFAQNFWALKKIKFSTEKI